MTSLIKYQIIKHLSKFARNVTPDQISVQILSGKGELKNIELNEVVLTEVLELPTWLRVKRARCNRVAVKVPWTRLKSSPVQLFVDEIQVEVELTSEGPLSSGSNPLSSFADSSYGFANRVIEGMSLYVNTVEIHFDSGVFGGSLMLSRLSVESKSPGWQPIADLRYSRIIDPTSNLMLMFKQVTWQLLRIEASAQVEPSQRASINAPLRLITSSGKSRIAVKKSATDGTVLGGRIQTILDDILWVATLPQVRSAIAFYSHIMKLVKAAPKKTDFQMPAHNQMKPPSATNRSSTPNLASKAFRNFDFDQTSYHLYVGKIDLHLCDDVHASSGYPADWDIDSGALQVTLVRLSIDFYPANVAASDRLNWVRYIAPNQCSIWIQQILKAHYKLLCARLGYPADWDIDSGALQVTLVRLSIDFYPANVAASDRLNWVRYIAPNQCSIWIQQILKAHYKLLCARLDVNAQNRLARIWPQLLSQNCVLRIHDVVVQCVTDMSSKRDALFNLFMSDRKSKASLPSDQPLVHLEFAAFYHPATETMPMPPNATHLLLGPFSFLLDQRTIRWVLYVYEDINNALQSLDASLEMDYIPRTDVRVDLLMPKIIIPLGECGTRDSRMPRRVLVSMSTVLATNCESVHSQDACSFFSSLSANVVDFIDSSQLPLNTASFRNFIIQLNQSEMLNNADGEERFWISTSPIWIDTDRGESSRSTPLVGDVALHAICDVSPKQVNVAVQPQCRVRAVVDHFQYVQLIRLLSTISLFVDQLEADQKFFAGERSNGSSSIPIAVLCLIEQFELNVILARGAIASPYAAHVRHEQCDSSPSVSDSTRLSVLNSTVSPLSFALVRIHGGSCDRVSANCRCLSSTRDGTRRSV
ncbi:UHRF1-binding protein 1-like [Toxocara canis]|uniref:UHRF1-binding protein 1-like n=1 Tax=Toxocara canis TaxID=6265 RepID=A0A0B2VGQ5_TOXCA|nr:UHRF1-binding protein 1-like [Toxocara canis]